LPSATDKYTTVAIAVHWLTVALVFTLFGLGWYMVDLPRGPDRSYYFALHKSIGLSVFALACFRLAWRLRHPPPPFPASISPWRAALAHAVHVGFYVMLVVQPLSGYLSSSFSGYATRWFGVPLPEWGWRDQAINEFFTEIHVLGSIALLLLIAMHVLGFLSHLLEGDDALLRRMRPW
jgi:cytochrome b561